MQLCYLSPGRP